MEIGKKSLENWRAINGNERLDLLCVGPYGWMRSGIMRRQISSQLQGTISYLKIENAISGDDAFFH